jgi:hypothetical protein
MISMSSIYAGRKTYSRVWLDRESGFLALGVVIARGLGFDFVDEVRHVVG